MKELLRSNDAVLISFVSSLLDEEGIDFLIADTNMSVLEGSIGALPRRVLVDEDEFPQASRTLNEAGIGNALAEDAKACADAKDDTSDAFLGGRISVLQPGHGHRSGSDAVWLQAAVPAKSREKILDVGAGVGVAGLCLLARIPASVVTAVEIDPTLCALAKANAARNGFADRFTAIEADITTPQNVLLAKGLVAEGYEHVMANPPYYDEGTVRASPASAGAHVMSADRMEVWLRFFAGMTAPKGLVTLICLPERLSRLLPLLDGRFGAIKIFPLYPREGAPATRFILQASKGSRAPLQLLPGLVLHGASGAYTDLAEAVLRRGVALDLGR
jgi:tRNA1(Val) A37 N6-methylase TrmN6